MQPSLWSGSTHTLDHSHFPTQVINVKSVGIEFMETFLRYNHKNHLIEAYLSEEVILIGRGCCITLMKEIFLVHISQPEKNVYDTLFNKTRYTPMQCCYCQHNTKHTS